MSFEAFFLKIAMVTRNTKGKNYRTRKLAPYGNMPPIATWNDFFLYAVSQEILQVHYK